MKTIRIFSLIALMMSVSGLAFAQTKTETFKVSGNCGMCKTKIEKAAKAAGAESATWNTEAKELTVTYNSSTTNTAKIQQKVADVGYDNAGFTATAEAYNKLHGCCKYERTTTDTHEAKMDCCKDGKCSKEGHEGKDCCKKSEKKSCCKDGEKCSKEGKSGKDCCKKPVQ